MDSIGSIVYLQPPLQAFTPFLIDLYVGMGAQKVMTVISQKELKPINENGGVEINGKSTISSEGILLRCTSESLEL
jgi:hypothetical protein